VTVFAIGHKAEFNTVSHVTLGPSARNDYQGKSGHFLLRRTQSTRRREASARRSEERYRPPSPSSPAAPLAGSDHSLAL
jgi:hypothetical protein